MSSTISEFLGFDPHTTEASESFGARQEAIPNGQYKAAVTSAKRTHTKSGKGWFWEMVFTVIEGQYEGHTVTHRFNMANPSEEAVAIGRSHMKRYLDCIGILDPKDESDLCDITVLITVACKKSTYTNRNGEPTEGINNEITKIDSLSNDPPPKQEPPKSAPGKEPSKVPPWQKKK
jgi:hypothetical protein